MSNNKLPAILAAETCLDFPTSVLPIVSRPSHVQPIIPEYCTEPYIVVFEKLSEPVDEASLDVLECVFNMDRQQAIDKAVLAKVGDKVQLMKTDFDTALFKIEQIDAKVGEKPSLVSDNRTISFSAVPASSFGRC